MSEWVKLEENSFVAKTNILDKSSIEEKLKQSIIEKSLLETELKEISNRLEILLQEIDNLEKVIL